MSKKIKNKIKVRRKWKIDPATQIHKVKTKEYNRSKERREWQQEASEALENDEDFFEEEIDDNF